MIILKEIEEYDIELRTILSLAVKYLEDRFSADKKLLRLSGTAFEKEVCDALNEVSIGFDFHNKFEQSSPHSFPDLFVKILTNKWFGIEVKTSQTDWKCFGNSIFETTGLPNLEDRIYIFFGKLTSKTLKCRWAKYDECVDNINITHSPRYQINMDIQSDPSLSVFNKMNISYRDFRKSDVSKRMEYVRNLKRQSVGQDIALWWLPDHEAPSKEDEEKLIIKPFSSLSGPKKSEIIDHAMALFPEVFSDNSKDKYTGVLVWLASHYGVVTGNLRDHFTAGGKYEVYFKRKTFRLPHICKHLVDGKNRIKKTIAETERKDLSGRWKMSIESIPESDIDRLILWISIIFSYLLKTTPTDFPLKEWLEKEFKIDLNNI